MFRLSGHVLPENKSIWIGLTSVYGIGLKRSKTILAHAKINYLKKVKDITEDEQKKIIEQIQKYILENDLKREVAFAIKRLKEIKCYRGMRHNLGLPVRGQVTRKNAKTAKKLLGRSKVRPVLKK
ncbi:MAG: 30S ribosomal protein S13 [Candidatus Absconditabacterales bacterium]